MEVEVDKHWVIKVMYTMDLKDVKSFGHIREDLEKGINYFLRPKGVIGSVVPSTNPIATPVNNIINSLENRKACLMSNHGQVAFGQNLKQAFELAEEVENICHQYVIALKLGEPKILSSSEMEKILDKVKYYKSE